MHGQLIGPAHLKQVDSQLLARVPSLQISQYVVVVIAENAKYDVTARHTYEKESGNRVPGPAGLYIVKHLYC
eukprot:1140532-Pelagomonas_calceolata.AAC.6